MEAVRLLRELAEAAGDVSRLDRQTNWETRAVEMAAAQERMIQALAKARRFLENRPVLRYTGPGELTPLHHEGDVGIDLTYIGPRIALKPGGFVDLDVGVALELPPGMWARIVGRSSTLRRRGLLVAEGTIDGGYRGQLFVGIWNLNPDTSFIDNGARLAQLIPQHNLSEHLVFERVAELAPSSRGEGGFGSTG